MLRGRILSVSMARVGARSCRWVWHRLAGTAAAAASALLGCRAPEQTPPRPVPTATPTPAPRWNVVLFIADDLNASVGVYGDPQARTPRIDALAARGVRFDRAYCAYPVCNPSRSSFLTGLFPDSIGDQGDGSSFRAHRPDVVSLPQLFRRNGYYTAGISKVFHDAPGMDNGGEWEYSVDFATTPTGNRGVGRDLRDGHLPCCSWLSADGTDDDQRDGQIARGAIEVLDHRPTDRPFFLAVGFHKPHEPFAAPRQYFDRFQPSGTQLRANDADDRDDVPAAALPAPFPFSDEDARELLRAYYASTSFMDAQVGRVVDALDRLGLTSTTVIVFLGDNGHHLGEFAHWSKGTLFEPSTRVPLILAGPGIGPGRVCSRTVELAGLYATLAELCSLPLAHAVDGASLGPLLTDPEAAWEPAYTQCRANGPMGRSVRTERWRYTEWEDGAQGLELYDVVSDPGEHVNLAGNPAYAPTMAELRTLLRKRWP
jgi:iduronate 2-sulfatase